MEAVIQLTNTSSRPYTELRGPTGEEESSAVKDLLVWSWKQIPNRDNNNFCSQSKGTSKVGCRSVEEVRNYFSRGSKLIAGVVLSSGPWKLGNSVVIGSIFSSYLLIYL